VFTIDQYVREQCGIQRHLSYENVLQLLCMKNDVHKGAMNFNFTVVVNETQFVEAVQEKLYA
jgi:hypothetical protein